jgi:hypothetical protein
MENHLDDLRRNHCYSAYCVCSITLFTAFRHRLVVGDSDAGNAPSDLDFESGECSASTALARRSRGPALPYRKRQLPRYALPWPVPPCLRLGSARPSNPRSWHEWGRATGFWPGHNVYCAFDNEPIDGSRLPSKRKQTRREVFMAEMERAVPVPEAVSADRTPKVGGGRPPYVLSTMLRIHCLQQWYGVDVATGHDRRCSDSVGGKLDQKQHQGT